MIEISIERKNNLHEFLIRYFFLKYASLSSKDRLFAYSVKSSLRVYLHENYPRCVVRHLNLKKSWLIASCKLTEK